MGGVKITDTDHGYRALQEASKRLAAIETFKIGVNDSPHPNSDLTNDELGAIHEFGLGNNPERSFLRAWLDDEKLWMPELEKEMWAALGGDPLGHSTAWAKRFGAFCVKSIQDRIRRHIPPPLLASTLNRKQGDDTPLIDTGTLINAIEVELKEGT
jgi:hypothetical protein